MAAIANRYAKALVDVVTKQGEYERTGRELARFESFLGEHRELRHFLTNPAIAVDKKRAVAGEIVKRLSFGPSTSNFISVLIDNHRIAHFSEICKAYQQALNAHLGVVQAEITTALELDGGTRQRLESGLARLTGKKVELRFRIDRDLIGGVITRIGDTVYDGSIRQRLESVRSRLSSG